MKIDAEVFRKEVYSVVAQIPCGCVTTYGEIARLIGRPQNSRLVGHVLRGASSALGLPCHRVVNAQGRTAPGFAEQHSLLEQEGVAFKPNGCVEMKRHLWHWEAIAMECE